MNKKSAHTLVAGIAILGICYDAQQEWKLIKKYGLTLGTLWGALHLIIELGLL